MLFALDNISNGNWEDIRTVVCILILVTTKKGSIVRLACIPVFTAILYLQLWGSSTSASTPFQVSSEGRSLGNYLHHLNLLVLIGVDLKTDATHSLWSRLKSAVFYYAFNLRGIGTVHQTKNIPELPRYFRGKSNPKYEFILRQVTIGFWEYLVADLGLSLLRRLSDERRSRYYGAGEEWISWTDGTAAQWRLRFLATLVFWPTLKVALDIGHRFGSALLTATGMTSMSEWPPMFGSITSAYKLRNFWG
ncbi:hypothetical protein P175DRAFT_0497881 [Aspergillus ochraceoroseus IBT 24754]|uniref:Wax synthase domain-containing protein n=1 Tax=Aspergillus ochraceoroseus IBT 24754 TaxID=1392256 RepID=A0A2T5M8B5_9EURO|nr:uncharacterized protein P175DRAFT_0497881 [Aspergillus ochraceoroseus IBT 24754]PTU24778.1 hypothetical protein P175DRAFT_0497881 [Aspergillus ochraceoroseus IBT 24754]